MGLSLRYYRLFNRHLKRPVGVKFFSDSAETATINKEANTGLLKSFNNHIKKGGTIPVFKRALLYPNKVALHDDSGIYTYLDLYNAAAALSNDIAYQLVGDTEKTVSYMCGSNASHIIAQWAIWMSGNIAVPLTSLHPPELLKYFITDSSSSLIISALEYEEILQPISLQTSIPLIKADGNSSERHKTPLISDIEKDNIFYGEIEAMLIYTSGTTSKPKGVVWSHKMLNAQIAALQQAWQCSARDVVLHALPLHHIHGQLNSLNLSLASGARIRMLPTFTPNKVWSTLLGMGDKDEAKVTVFHGVPAMYARLVTEHEQMFTDNKTREYVRNTLSSRMRLMCAGSSALPASLYNKWEQISGHRLLERYGMSEVGMALSNPYRPTENRTVAAVGLPLPGVCARVAIVDDTTQDLKPLVTVESNQPDLQISLKRLENPPLKETTTDSNENNEWPEPKITIHSPAKDNIHQGELLLKGPGVFTTYWNKSTKINSKDFTTDGWFKTGDTVSFSNSDNTFKILGRTSSDMIKTAGYRISALEVESAISENPNINDVAIIGEQHETYGEVIIAVVVLKKDCQLTLRELKDDAGKRLAPYQLPRRMVIVEEMPRNTMGKLDKKVIKQMVVNRLRKK